MKLQFTSLSLFLSFCLAACGDQKSDGKTAEKKDPPKAEAKSAGPSNPAALTDPSKATLKAPETFKVKVVTTKGDFTLAINRSWSPNGADRFYNLVEAGFFKDIAVFRVIDGFMAQFGIHGDPAIAAKWRAANIPDDPGGKTSNTPGKITFATAGPNTRSTQFFINFGNNGMLDGQGFTPFGEVSEGMDVVNKIYKGYGEGAPRGRGPDQGRAQAEGNAYFKKDFPELDYIKSMTVLK